MNFDFDAEEEVRQIMSREVEKEDFFEKTLLKETTTEDAVLGGSTENISLATLQPLLQESMEGSSRQVLP